MISRRQALAALLPPVAVAGIYLGSRQTPRSQAVSPLHLLWCFSAPRPGGVVASPRISGDNLLLTAIHVQGFRLDGMVYAIDTSSGKLKWTFDADGEMLASASTALVVNDLMYLGEGMHANFSCHFYCVDTTSRSVKWSVPTGDHIEGGAVRVNDLVIFPAGNEGLHAVNATTGALRWNSPLDLHIDCTPAVEGDRVYFGSGPSRKRLRSIVGCLDTASGRPIWRREMPLPAWASPSVTGGRVHVGLGNGRLTERAELPAGGLVVLDAADGETLWMKQLPDAVFGKPLVVNNRIIVGSRDGSVRGFALDGTEHYRIDLGGPVIASPVHADGRVFAVSVPGLLICLDSENGHEYWRHQLTDTINHTYIYSEPLIVGKRCYVADESRPAGSAVGVVSLSCFEFASPP
jgi:outer membrane protein assembly factor BamB